MKLYLEAHEGPFWLKYAPKWLWVKYFKVRIPFSYWFNVFTQGKEKTDIEVNKIRAKLLTNRNKRKK